MLKQVQKWKHKTEKPKKSGLIYCTKSRIGLSLFYQINISQTPVIGWQRDEGHWPAGGNGVASSRGNKIKEKKRVAWRETNQSYENKNQLYGQNHKFNDQQTIPYNMNKIKREK